MRPPATMYFCLLSCDRVCFFAEPTCVHPFMLFWFNFVVVPCCWALLSSMCFFSACRASSCSIDACSFLCPSCSISVGFSVDFPLSRLRRQAPILGAARVQCVRSVLIRALGSWFCWGSLFFWFFDCLSNVFLGLSRVTYALRSGCSRIVPTILHAVWCFPCPTTSSLSFGVNVAAVPWLVALLVCLPAVQWFLFGPGHLKQRVAQSSFSGGKSVAIFVMYCLWGPRFLGT